MNSETPPRVSLMTVVRNDKAGLQRTFDSVMSQSWTDWEMLIKDGNSDDGTADLAEELAASEPRVRIVPGKDRNLYDAMNIVVKAARGSYVLALNAGDSLYDSGSLAMAMQHMETDNPDIAYFTTRVEMETGKSYDRAAKPPEYIEYGQPAIHQSTLIRTSLHQTQLYDFETYPNVADYVAVARMVRDGASARSYPETLARFEITAASNSFRNQKTAAKEFSRSIAEIWSPGPLKSLKFRSRRWLAMYVVRYLMR